MIGVDIIVAPFPCGTRHGRVGNGPGGLLEAGLIESLQAAGADTQLVSVPSVDAFDGEIGRSFEMMRRVATTVSTAVRASRFPLVLAGNCDASVGTFAGLQDDAAAWSGSTPTPTSTCRTRP